MTQDQRPSQFGRFKVPAILVGAALSVAAHAAALVVIDAVVSGDSASNDMPPKQIVSRGKPIHVYLIPSDTPTEPGPSSDAKPPLTPNAATELALSRMTQADHIVPPIRPGLQTARQTPDKIAPDMLASVSRARSIFATLAEATPDRSLTPQTAPDSVIPKLPTPLIETHIAPLSIRLALPDDVAQPPRNEADSTTASKPRAPTDPSFESRKLGLQRDAEATEVPSPVYPVRSIRLGQYGDVEIAVEVLASGRVGRVQIRVRSRHRLLNEAALDAARRAHFRPATIDGRPVRSNVILPFEFRLR